MIGSLRLNSVSFCMIVLLCVGVVLVDIPQSAGADETRAKVDEAFGALIDAYSAVFDAEKVGADVSALTNELNSAQSLLNDANASFSNGDYEYATSLANQCISLTSQIIQDASNLQALTVSRKSNSLFQAFSLSAIALILLSVLSLLGWKFIKKRYIKRALSMKPTVTGNA